jgi:hypothetical protein
MSVVDGAGSALGIDHIDARWDIRYHVLNAGGGLPRRNPFNTDSGVGGGGGPGDPTRRRGRASGS